MLLTRFWLIAVASLGLTLPSEGYAPAPFPRSRPRSNSLVGKWTVKFTNGVIQTSELRKNGTASVVERNRSSTGKAVARNGAVVIHFKDDRAERWTVRGKQVMVEHWFPASTYPSGGRVLGFAKRLP